MMKKVLWRPEFWIVVFFLVRFVGITNPPLETGHNWRQVFGLMVARNFMEVDAQIVYPRVDDTQGGTGITGMEFPLLNYLHYVVSLIFGYAHWYGRLINLVFSSMGLYFFAKLSAQFFSRRVALAATIFLIGSLWFAYSRKMMPDTFSVSLVLGGLYFGLRYLGSGSIVAVILCTLFLTAGVASKIPAAIYLAVLLPFMRLKSQGNRKVILLSLLTIPIATSAYWYFIWNPHLSDNFGAYSNFGGGILEGATQIAQNLDLTWKNFYFHSFCSYTIFLCFIVGLYMMISNKNKTLTFVFTTIGLAFGIYMLKAGFLFYHHSYYIIPFVPVMALVAGYAVAQLKKNWIYAALLFIGLAESVGNQQHDFFIKGSDEYRMQLEQIADEFSERTDLIAVNGDGNPQLLYLAHRKGWTCSNVEILQAGYVQKIRNEGCKYLVIDKNTFNEQLGMPVIYSDKNFIVYALQQANL